jgi:hypothetical protein
MIRVAIILFSFIVLASCKTRQKLHPKNHQVNANCKVASNSKADLIAHFDTSGLQFEWIKVKAKINTTLDDTDFSFTASFRVKKDSLVFASITKAGIPFAKLHLTKDSIQVIDLFHRQQKTGTFDELSGLIGFKLPFEVIQKFLFGKPAFLYNDEGEIKSDSLATYYNLPDTMNNFSQQTLFQCDTIDLKSMKIDYEGKKIQIRYSNPEDINGYLLNKNIVLSVKAGEKVIILAEIEIERVKKFNNLKIPFSIPVDYERMD